MLTLDGKAMCSLIENIFLTMPLSIIEYKLVLKNCP